MPTFQNFYSDTLGARFIKSLLAQTPIPLFDSVVDGDHIVNGCYYVYRHFIIKCHTSGILSVPETEVGKLVPSETLFPSIFLVTDTGYVAARFYVVSYVHDESIKTHTAYRSNTNYYDPDTHYHLGRYLRYLLTTTGLNLFPYYNSYNFTQFSDVKLNNDVQYTVGISRTTKSKHKVVAVPILFGHNYNIHLDCSSQVLMRACIHDNNGYVEEYRLPKSLAETLQNSGQIYSRIQFSNPVTFRIESADIESVMLQKDLYLVIQLPIDNESSIVVQENYKTTSKTFCDSNSCRMFPDVINPSLISLNTNTTYAFSNRLLEYLLDHVITEHDPITKNIEEVQTSLAAIYPEYNKSFIKRVHKKGFWDSDIKRLVLDLYEKTADNQNIYDQDGFINRDIYSIIKSRGSR